MKLYVFIKFNFCRNKCLNCIEETRSQIYNSTTSYKMSKNQKMEKNQNKRSLSHNFLWEEVKKDM